MSGKVMRWNIERLTDTPPVIRIIGECDEAENESKMISICYCFAALAKNLRGCIPQVRPMPKFEIDHDGTIVFIHFMFKDENDMKTFVHNAIIDLAKFG